MKDYKRIVFLDIDGVMASTPFLCKGKGLIDPEKNANYSIHLKV